MNRKTFEVHRYVSYEFSSGKQTMNEPNGYETSDLKDAILENARGPKRVQGDAGSIEQHSLKDQIEAERFLQSKKATQRPGLGIRLHKIAADGAV